MSQPASHETRADSAHSAGTGAAKTAAVGLWVLVSAALVYGVSQTAVRVAALFG
jgi:hypothetical protein